MAILFIAKNKDLLPWIESFNAFDNSLEIYTDTQDHNKDNIIMAIVWSTTFIDFKEYENLKCVASMGAGVNHILGNPTINENIPITKIVDEKLVDSMWEYLLSSVMSLLTNNQQYYKQQSQNIWEQKEAKTICNTTIGIMGLGQLGTNIAQRFLELGFKVKGYAKSKKNLKNISSFIEDEQKEFLSDLDFLINLMPLTKDTRYIFNIKLFKQCPKNCHFINVGRGKSVVDEDLIAAINSNIISGATLDVFRKEPLPKDHLFWNMEKITITPHSASLTDPNSVTKQIIENYYRVSNGEKPLHMINRKVGY